MSTSSTIISVPLIPVTPPRRRSLSPPGFSDKFEHLLLPLPRRPPPTALRLVSGPLPNRARPKHTLPSLPRPAFYPKIHLPRTGPTPRKLSKEGLMSLERQVPAIHLAQARVIYPELRVPGYGSDGESDSDDDSSSFSSGGSSRGSFESLEESLKKERGRTLRGPWDHAGTIKVPIDVKAVLTPPRRAAVSVLQRT